MRMHRPNCTLNSEAFKTTCKDSAPDPSTYSECFNDTFFLYTCRAGYRFESGDQWRECDANGTLSGSPLVCAVDSILPKAYLVILIVGATVAVFLACIPYDFYRFRKRKKKVRDHQERLSLVTRIAPGHAKVVVETVPVEENLSDNVQRPKFGLKSLLSVFRFVGGKMRSPQLEVSNPMCSDEKNSDGELRSNRSFVSDAASESENAKVLSYTDSLKPSPSCPCEDNIASCPLLDARQAQKKNDQEEEITIVNEDMHVRPPSRSPLVLKKNDVKQNSGCQSKKGFQIFKNANEILLRDLDSYRHTTKTSNSKSVPSPENQLLSEPATVEVTLINGASSSGVEPPRVCAQDDLSTLRVGSTSSSNSSPDVASLRKVDPKVASFRTIHYPSGKSSIAYHSMPTFRDIP